MIFIYPLLCFFLPLLLALLIYLRNLYLSLLDLLLISYSCLYEKLNDASEALSVATPITMAVLEDHRLIVDRLVVVGVGDIPVDPRGSKLRASVRALLEGGLLETKAIIENR